MMLKPIIKYLQTKNKTKFKNSSLFYLILNYLNINLEKTNNPFLDCVSSVLILHIIILLGTINIVFYLLSNYLILKFNIENKFSKLKKLLVIKLTKVIISTKCIHKT